MMNANFSERINNILNFSHEEAARLGNDYIGNEHLFLGMLREGQSPVLSILSDKGLNLSALRKTIEFKIKSDYIETEDDDLSELPLNKSTERTLRLVYLEAKAMKKAIADTEHLLLAILKEENMVSDILKELDFDYAVLKAELNKSPIAKSENSEEDNDEEGEDFDQKSKKAQSDSHSNSSTPVLDNFGVDLTRAAEEGTLDPIVGRDIEIERMVQILSRRKKNNPILIGEPGVGKSAIAEGLAIRIIQKKVSRVLFDKRIVTLDLASVVAGTKYRGQFEERMKSILNELSETNDVILFIDEIHTIVGAGGASGSLDASNMLKPALARGEIQCIGATTLDEFRQHIEKDGALERRFQKILIEPTSIEETVEILHNIKDKYEEHHNVNYTEAALMACVKLTNRYISDRHLPDKAIDALDESGSRVHISKIKVPERIDALEKEIETVKTEKIDAVKNQQFEKAANFRDKEHLLSKELEEEKKNWEANLAENREIVDFVRNI